MFSIQLCLIVMQLQYIVTANTNIFRGYAVENFSVGRTPLFWYLVTQEEYVNSYSWILRVVLRAVTPIRPQNCVTQINKAPLVEAQKLQW